MSKKSTVDKGEKQHMFDMFHYYQLILIKNNNLEQPKAFFLIAEH